MIDMRKFLIGGIVILLLTSCTAVRQVVAIKDLKIKFQNVELARITLEGVDLNLNFKAHNPNRMNAILSGFAVDIFANNMKVGKATLNKTLKVPAGGNATFTIPLHLSWRELSNSLSNAIRKKSVTFWATGYALINTPLGKLRFKVADYTREFR